MALGSQPNRSYTKNLARKRRWEVKHISSVDLELDHAMKGTNLTACPSAHARVLSADHVRVLSARIADSATVAESSSSAMWHATVQYGLYCSSVR